jgi:hypothetical protein
VVAGSRNRVGFEVEGGGAGVVVYYEVGTSGGCCFQHPIQDILA